MKRRRTYVPRHARKRAEIIPKLNGYVSDIQMALLTVGLFVLVTLVAFIVMGVAL